MPSLDDQELQIIGQCLKAVAHGPFLVNRDADDPLWEFFPLMGLLPKELSDIADRWPNIDLASAKVQRAINNSMNNLLGYPHGCWAEWLQYISVSPAEVARVLDKWRTLTAQVDGQTSSEYFNRLM